MQIAFEDSGPHLELACSLVDSVCAAVRAT